MRSLAVICILIIMFVAAILLLPNQDLRGVKELEQIQLGPLTWKNESLPSVIDQINKHIAASHKERLVIRLGKSVDVSKLARVNLQLGKLSAAEYAKYLTDLNSLFVYSTDDGVVLDYFHQDHRSLHRKIRDWVQYDLLDDWSEPPAPIRF